MIIIKNNTNISVTLHIGNNEISLLSDKSYNYEDTKSIMVLSCLGSCVIIPEINRIRFINHDSYPIYAHENNGNVLIELR